MPFSDFYRGRFPFRTPGGPFWSLSIENHISFARNSLTGSPISVPSVPTGHSTLELSTRPGFRFFPRRFPFRTPGGPFYSLSLGTTYVFARNSLTGSPICVPSFPTSHSTLELSARTGFGFFPPPFPISDNRRAVLEPKCRKIRQVSLVIV